MKNIKRQFQYALLAVMTMFTVGLATPYVSTVAARCESTSAGARTFTFPKWFSGLPGTCRAPKIERLNDIWVIVLNLVEILLQAVAYVSTGFIIWGGFKYIKSQGDPGKISEAKMAIINAVIGLVVAMASVAIVQYVSKGLIT